MPLRFPVAPMKATIGSLPGADDDANWAYEIKWDGYRTIVFVDVGARSVRVQSSSGRDVTSSYPELGRMWSGINARTAVLDGEIVVFDDDGLPSFGALQQHRREVVFHAFDVLAIDDVEVGESPYERRRALLAQLMEPGSNWLVPAHRVGGGAALFAVTRERGLEGVMAKRLGSAYVPGTRTTAWRKVKHRRELEVVIGGFTPGSGSRSSTFGALLVGIPTVDGLRFAGGVGTGFTQARLDGLRARLATLATADCPFTPAPPREVARDAVWVQPELRATIEIAELTNDGLVRHASFVDLVPPHR
jgi:bifunctional non-homologous end joining protein LigD